jgi:hypothetical protein
MHNTKRSPAKDPDHTGQGTYIEAAGQKILLVLVYHAHHSVRNEREQTRKIMPNFNRVEKREIFFRAAIQEKPGNYHRSGTQVKY